MTAENETCIAGPSVTYLTCLVQMFLDWLGLENLEDYLNYLDYLMWVFTPLIIVFILPFLIVIFLYLSILFLHVYKRKNELKEAYSNSIWDGARKTLATLWDGHATIWHGKTLLEVLLLLPPGALLQAPLCISTIILFCWALNHKVRFHTQCCCMRNLIFHEMY